MALSLIAMRLAEVGKIKEAGETYTVSHPGFVAFMRQNRLFFPIHGIWNPRSLNYLVA